MIYDNDALDEARADPRRSAGIASQCGRRERIVSTNTHAVGEIWWRLEAGRGCDTPHVELQWVEYRVTRVTPKGVWLVPHAFFAQGYTPRFALLGASRWVSPTKGEAATRFSARKRRQIAICRGQIDDAEEALDLVSAWSAE